MEVFSNLRLFPKIFFLTLIVFKVERLKIVETAPAGENKNLHTVSDLFKGLDDLATNDSKIPANAAEDLENLFKIVSEKSFTNSKPRQRPAGFYNPANYGTFGQNPNFGYPGGFYPPPALPPGYQQGLDSGGFGLIDALNSISQHDDLKCVPRLLCEIATGSSPGNGDYKASGFAEFGKNTLLGLLTAYNLEAASPVLGFGKAALLGYTNRGDPSICYNEYVRCPNDPRDLVHYLNNHNGGFFRFFRNGHGTGRRRKSSEETWFLEKPATRNHSHFQRGFYSFGSVYAKGMKRISFVGKRPAPPPGLSGPESDRTGTGKLKFDVPDEEQDIPAYRDSFSKVVFPKDDEEAVRGTRVSKSLVSGAVRVPGFFPDDSVAASSSENHRFHFPSREYDYDRDTEKANIVIFENSSVSKKGRLVDFGSREEEPLPSSSSLSSTSLFKFPESGYSENFDDDPAVLVTVMWKTGEKKEEILTTTSLPF
ncbi:uncharacterized protein LOC125501644 isoform X2 [Athalia rosae]|uniref:uncharacterized protein LOC125501644 isoform X2 n=1 Tax=Athalia rosae TaxID=37344 RepID=UPI00203459BF|nr:uncharacterized protein LOC125501644 isoform X2 [Athalia rosae]